MRSSFCRSSFYTSGHLVVPCTYPVRYTPCTCCLSPSMCNLPRLIYQARDCKTGSPAYILHEDIYPPPPEARVTEAYLEHAIQNRDYFRRNPSQCVRFGHDRRQQTDTISGPSLSLSLARTVYVCVVLHGCTRSVWARHTESWVSACEISGSIDTAREHRADAVASRRRYLVHRRPTAAALSRAPRTFCRGGRFRSMLR